MEPNISSDIVIGIGIVLTVLNLLFIGPNVIGGIVNTFIIIGVLYGLKVTMFGDDDEIS